MIFSKHITREKLSISLGTDIIQQTDTYKYLGITLDSKLSFNHYVDLLINRLANKIWLLAKTRAFIYSNTSILLYKTMTLPYFDYGDIFYDIININLKN